VKSQEFVQLLLGVLPRHMALHQLAQLTEGQLRLAHRAFGVCELYDGIPREPIGWLHNEPANRCSRFACLAANTSWQPRAAVEMFTHLLGQISAAARTQVPPIPQKIGRKFCLPEILGAAGALGHRVVEAVVK